MVYVLTYNILCFADGEFHFMAFEEKIQKHAPKAWKSSNGEV